MADPTTEPMAMEAIALAQALVRRPSVTPDEAGALDLAAAALEATGFEVHRQRFAGDGAPPVDNLFARIGSGAPHFCFAGHTDVTPPGDAAAWAHPPFGGVIADGALWGRGSEDMKGAIGAFVAAARAHLSARGSSFQGSLSVVLTGDEEGWAVNGTAKMVDWMRARGHIPDACVIGEPTHPERMGDEIKIGRRGSVSGRLRVEGLQGHVAYAGQARNPVPPLARAVGALEAPLDAGTRRFEPTTLAVTRLSADGGAANIVPGAAEAAFNIRFNDAAPLEAVKAAVRARVAAALDGADLRWTLDFTPASDLFSTPPGPLSDLVASVSEHILGRRPALSTTGGASDARFLKELCPVVEFGLVSRTLHQVDEHAPLADIAALTQVYRACLDRFFAPAA